MVTILSKSENGGRLKGFRTFTWNSSNNLSDSATKTFWQIKSNFHKFKFIEFLKLKSIYSELSEEELRCLIDAPGVLNDKLFVEAKIAKANGISIEILGDRLNILRKLLGRNEWSANLLYTLNGDLKYEILELRSAIRPATKYSGYVRNSSQVGNKNSQKPNHLDPEIYEWNLPVEIDFLHFLTVGEFSLGSPEGHFFTLMRTKSSKR
jgi:hypothetical protein